MVHASEQVKAVEGETYLVFGKSGWIGGMLQDIMKSKGITFKLAQSRLQNRESVAKELDEIKPTHVLNAAGVTGRPNVDWCEDHKIETVRTNVLGTLTLADLCSERGIHCTIFATGCIFHYDEKIGRPWPKWQEETRDWSELKKGEMFTEEDTANFSGSFYSHTKGMLEQMLKLYPGVLTLRVRMPISDDLSPRNFLTKISTYEKVVNIPNSMTVLHDLLPVSMIMAQRKLEGVYNFTNPGIISHNQCLDLYKQYIDPEFTYKNFTIAEQAKVIKAERSNNWLDTDKIVAALPDVEVIPIIPAMHGCYQRMKKHLEEKGEMPAQKRAKVSK